MNIEVQDDKHVPQFSRRHAAFLIKVNPRTIKRWIDDEKIFAYKLGNRGTWYIPLPEINRMREIHGIPALTPTEAIKEASLY